MFHGRLYCVGAPCRRDRADRVADTIRSYRFNQRPVMFHGRLYCRRSALQARSCRPCRGYDPLLQTQPAAGHVSRTSLLCRSALQARSCRPCRGYDPLLQVQPAARHVSRTSLLCRSALQARSCRPCRGYHPLLQAQPAARHVSTDVSIVVGAPCRREPALARNHSCQPSTSRTIDQRGLLSTAPCPSIQ